MSHARRGAGAYLLLIGWAAVLGLAGGLSCVSVRLFFRLLQWVLIQKTGMLPYVAAELSKPRRFATPIAGAALATGVMWAVGRWSKTPHATDYVEAVRHHDGHIPFISTLWRTLSSAFSVASGAAIGREGSMIQFATATTSWVGQGMRRMPLPRQVACGVAAAVAAAYQAPIAGVFFAAEIVLGEVAWPLLLSLLIAASAGWACSRLILGKGPLFAIEGSISLTRQALWAIPIAVGLGLAGPIYQWLLRSLRFIRGWPMPMVIGGIVVGALSLRATEVWGNGDAALLLALRSTPALTTIAIILGLRLIATTFCVGGGTVGGVFTPTCFTGAAAGLAAAHLVHAGDPVALSLAGLSAFLAAVTHAPLMAAFMAVELTGQWRALPLLLVCNMISMSVARSLSRSSLYAIASSTPSDQEPETEY